MEVKIIEGDSLKAAMADFSAVVVDCGKLLDESLQIWTSLQEDPYVEKM